MADWNQPVVTSRYTEVLDLIKNRDVDSAKMFKQDAVNMPNDIVKMVRLAENKFRLQERLAGAWVDKTLGLTGGGTGVKNLSSLKNLLGLPAGALNLGTIASQNADNVAITGGSIDPGAINPLSADKINSGVFIPARIPVLDIATKTSGNLSASRISDLPPGRVPIYAVAANGEWSNAGNQVFSVPVSDIDSYQYITIAVWTANSANPANKYPTSVTILRSSITVTSTPQASGSTLAIQAFRDADSDLFIGRNTAGTIFYFRPSTPISYGKITGIWGGDF